MPDLELCTMHVGRTDPAKLVGVSERLIKLTGMALDRLEEIIRDGADDVAERAARTILDRTVPKPGAQHAVLVNVNPQPTVDGQVLSPAQIVRQRLAQLALVSVERQRADEAEIIDAELVD